ncbi:MAG TPA: patatin-like phospholipase family protein, partial [Myxococcales bacterium]|nr:patatin-like phospholipase family protein [Myxococcales bacterium]
METRSRAGQPLRCPGPIAFVFSGGSSLGALHAGMLRAVHEAGLVPDFLVGTSAGALNAAFVGKGLTAGRLSELAGVWAGMKTKDVFPGLGVWSSLRAALGSGTLASPAGLERIIERHVAATHAELAIPTAVIASDLATGSAVAFREGDLRRHVLASASIPGVFPPVTAEGRTFIDGGVSSHVPLLPARDLGAKTMVVFDTGF